MRGAGLAGLQHGHDLEMVLISRSKPPGYYNWTETSRTDKLNRRLNLHLIFNTVTVIVMRAFAVSTVPIKCSKFPHKIASKRLKIPHVPVRVH